MGYVKPTSAEDIDPATIEAMARLLGLTFRRGNDNARCIGTGSAGLRSVPRGTRPDRRYAGTRIRPALGVVRCVN